MMRFSEDRIESVTCSDGIPRDIHIWEPVKPRGVFLAVHGAMDYGGNFATVGLHFRKNGIAVLAHDMQGHDGQRIAHVPRFEVFLDDLELMLARVKEEYGGLPVFILAHSMGGLVAAHFGLNRLGNDPVVKGFIISSPYFYNAVKVPWIMVQLSGLFSMIAPKMKAPVEDIINKLTNDREIHLRHIRDRQDSVKASGITIRFGHEIVKAQEGIQGNLSNWEYPLLVFLGGKDQVMELGSSRKLLGQINPGLLTEYLYPDNLHENFNELNREEIFDRIREWIKPRI